MNRIKALWTASPRRVLGAACAVSVAGAVVMGSGANFTSVSANPNNTFTAGTLTHSNSKTGAAILTASGLKPADTTTGVVDIGNTGGLSSTFTLKKLNVTNSDAVNPLASKLTVQVDNCGTPEGGTTCTTPVLVYNGTIAAMGDLAVGTFTAAQSKRFKFTVTFPNGTPAVDNLYQGDDTSVEYQWEATQ